MIYWSAIFFIIALFSAALGFGGLYDQAADIGKVLFFIFVVLFLVSFLVATFENRRR